MRGFLDKQEFTLFNTRKIVFEQWRGNVNYKLKDRPKRESDVFKLRLDGDRVIVETKVSQAEADAVERLGFKVIKTLIN